MTVGAFSDAVFRISQPSGMARERWGGSRTIGRAEFVLSVDSYGACLELLEVPVRHRRTGHGTEALRRITELADRHGVWLELVAAPIDPRSDITEDDLIRFYKRAGFVFTGRDGVREPVEVAVV